MSTRSYLPVTELVHGTASEKHDCGNYASGVYKPLVVTMNADALVPPSDFPPSFFEEEQVSSHRRSEHGPKWSDVRKDGRVKMTNLSVGSEKTVNRLGTFLCSSYDFDHLETARVCTDKSGRWYSIWYGPWNIAAESHWRENGPLAYWKLRFPTAPHATYSLGSLSEIEKAKTEAWNEVLNGYSFSSEMGEIMSTASTIMSLLRSARHPIESFITARDLLIKQAKSQGIHKADLLLSIGNLWMQYRYAIMPIIYSICDIKKLLANSPEYITARKTINHPAEPNMERPQSGTYFHDEYDVTCVTHITVKGHWSGGSSSLDRVDFNILTMAWELIPLSFVVDWFVNVGDWLASYLRSYSTSADVIGCVATRTSITRRTFLTYERDEVKTRTWPQVTGGAWPGGSPLVIPAYTRTMGSVTSQTKLLQEFQSETYERKVFTQDDLGLALAPFMNWKRYVDSSVLLLQKLQSVLRKLK